MADKERRKQGESIKLPQELQESLRREIAPYLAKGEKPPTRGDLLLEAWRNFKMGTVPEPVPREGLTEAQRSYVTKLHEILLSGDETVIDAVSANIDVFYERLRPARRGKRPGPRDAPSAPPR